VSRAYPWRGLGLSSNLGAGDQPHPYRLLDAHPGAFDYLEYSAPLSLTEAREQASLFKEMWERRAQVPVLFHPVHLNLYGPQLESEQALAALAEHARAVGSAWVGNDIAWWHSGGVPFPGYLFVTPPLEAAGVKDAAAHARWVQQGLGETPLLIENPAIITRRGGMHVLEFMRAVHEETGCDLLIDLGHLWSHQLSRGLPLVDDAFAKFPWDRVIELHIAGGVVTRSGDRGFYVDDHTQPIREELFKLLREVFPRCSNLKALTYEGDGHPREIAVRTLSRLRDLLGGASAPVGGSDLVGAGFGAGVGRWDLGVGVRPSAGGAVAASFIPQTRPWELFEQVHGVASEGVEDPEGLNVEIDFRAAVIAELLDGQWPMTRLLLAGTRERLRAFLASNEYRQQFEGRTGGLHAAFASWARRACLSQQTAPFASAVALETWTQSLHRHREVDPSQVRLAPGVFLGTFPADLSELAFAVKALRRHLGGRAWASGLLDVSALEALGQIAKRAPVGGLNLVVRKSGPRTEVLTLGEGVFRLLRAAETGLSPGEMQAGPWSESDLAEVRRRGLLLLPG